MATFKDTFNKYLFFGLIVLAMMSYIIVIQGDNDAPQPLGADPRINITYSNLRGNISDAQNTSQTQYGLFNDEKPERSFGSIVLFGIVAVGKTSGTIISNFFTIILKLPLVVLGIDPSIISILTTWAVITIVIGLWLLYKLGG